MGEKGGRRKRAWGGILNISTHTVPSPAYNIAGFVEHESISREKEGGGEGKFE